MASYDIAQYLLDRANIHDTVVKVNLEGLRSEVYAASVENDYTSLLGGTSTVVPREDWVNQVGGILGHFASTQHVTSGIITNLPQPTANATRPEKVTIYAQVAGNMVGENAEDGSAQSLMQNGGFLEAELQRDMELERQGQNPWRITKYKVIKRWAKGEAALLDHAKDAVSR
ncbi:hypothetical protein C8A05DRAFT_43601 [Staphylotrichum tortipilum]|uniref:SnoaL-like domain-containing protein n=1 Tax=Staphylotrichum tortipilum TaxID=2831512 RepID=A0AAN6MMG5_9PEZI|nr:hypothetical protein C8A05DRAFT_43601 [Staphylotrichum longicolle]